MFDRPVSDSGYAWWYVDGLSDDAKLGITVIAFIGSVFSPAYARARARGPADPMDFCALNVALYRADGSTWAMTPWPRSAVSREAGLLGMGGSSLCWNSDHLRIDIDERTPWIGRRVRGTVRFVPEVLFEESFALGTDGLHEWTPYAPVSRVEVEMSEPDLRFCGSGYLDINAGQTGLEKSFLRWNWSRARTAEGAAVLYDAVANHGEPQHSARLFRSSGKVEEMQLPQSAELPNGWWGVGRQTRLDAGGIAKSVRLLEDSPFYTRSVLQTDLCGERALAMHESLDLERLVRPSSRFMLPFRMRGWQW